MRLLLALGDLRLAGRARCAALRWIFPVYGVACLAFFFVSSAVGENIARLRYAAIPVTVLVLSMRRLAAADPRADRLRGSRSRGTSRRWRRATRRPRTTRPPTPRTGRRRSRSCTRNLTPSYRVEAVDTTGHWAALYLARADIPLARGWFRQDDFPQNEVLYDDLGPKAYIGLAARASASGTSCCRTRPSTTAHAARRRCCVSGRTPLRPVFASTHLTVFEVPRATPILTGPPGSRVVRMTESRIVDLGGARRARTGWRCASRGTGASPPAARRAGTTA